MKLWGGNYSTDPDAVFWEFNRSFPFDKRLLAEETVPLRRVPTFPVLEVLVCAVSWLLSHRYPGV